MCSSQSPSSDHQHATNQASDSAYGVAIQICVASACPPPVFQAHDVLATHRKKLGPEMLVSSRLSFLPMPHVEYRSSWAGPCAVALLSSAVFPSFEDPCTVIRQRWRGPRPFWGVHRGRGRYVSMAPHSLQEKSAWPCPCAWNVRFASFEIEAGGQHSLTAPSSSGSASRDPSPCPR